MDVSRKEAIEALRNNVMVVEYERADGSIRYAMATLQESYLPKRETVWLDNEQKTVNENLVTYWDIDSDAWRSFRLDRVKQFTVRSD